MSAEANEGKKEEAEIRVKRLSKMPEKGEAREKVLKRRGRAKEKALKEKYTFLTRSRNPG